MPALAATSATPEPMSPEPTIPSCLTAMRRALRQMPRIGEPPGYSPVTYGRAGGPRRRVASRLRHR